ncbi:hypothetical protein DV515_00013558 [Chloebia gouldiae]|uniref:Uncharacterized protein n=1 Tax=Chloebia gouldiae TaxID=44316 RepID=A0A3L8S130_CHLGU|nr:hypothetical protein DV515_00013558 [Chloebia gouldiae]
MVISLLLGFFGIIVSVMGMKCTKVWEEDPVTKSRIAVGGGVLFVLSEDVPDAKALAVTTWERVMVHMWNFSPGED